MLGNLPEEIRAIVADPTETPFQALQSALHKIADAFAAPTAALHVIDPSSDPAAPDLVSVADRGVPDAVRAHTQRIPFGKGMAGICAFRKEPVTVCNLQTDDSGIVRPGAKDTGVAGAIVIPIFSGGSTLLGTLGIGKITAHTYSADEVYILTQCASVLSPLLGIVARTHIAAQT